MVGQYVKYGINAVRATTDENGRYRLPPSEPGEYVLAVVADGFAPNSRKVSLTEEQRDFDLQLQQAEPIRIRIVDQDGNPIPEATVNWGLDREILFLDNTHGAQPGNDRNLTADAEGKWSRLWIPGDYVDFTIEKDGYESVEKSFKPSEQEQVVTLRAGDWSVSGRVVDRETKAPVTDFFIVEGYAGREEQVQSWRQRQPVKDDNGRYRASWNTSGDSRRVVRVEAEGYLPSKPRFLKADEVRAVYDVELEKSNNVTGVVLTPDGKPLSGADVVLCTPSRGLYLKDSELLPGQNSLVVRTSADGRFSFSPSSEPFVLIAIHDQGFARIEGVKGANEIVLQPWARVEGTLRIHGEPAANESVSISYEALPPADSMPRTHYDYRTTTDQEGCFVFEKVVPGDASVRREVVMDMGRGVTRMPPTHIAKTTLTAGQTTLVELGRIGRTVVGTLQTPKGQGNYDWRYANTDVLVLAPSSERPIPPQMPIPKDIDPQKDREAAMKWWESWKDTDEGKQFQREMQRYQEEMQATRPDQWYGVIDKSNGKFTFDDLPAGDYRLSVRAEAEPEGEGESWRPRQQIAHLSHEFRVPELKEDHSQEPLDLGTLTLQSE